VIFLIGGAFGVSEEVRSRAQLKVSFSAMVFNHLVAELVALEQIYRAFTIIKNLPYHNV
jgi:23S rRNA (pseudouridine1915-N3)-methyltransferase